MIEIFSKFLAAPSRGWLIAKVAWLGLYPVAQRYPEI
jgi:hypothetical protein